jgi:hypothetical protein
LLWYLWEELAGALSSHFSSPPRVAVRALLAALALLALGCACVPAAFAADPVVAAFHRDPGDSVVLLTGQPATFTSDSTPCSRLSWAVDGVPFGSAQSITHAFADPGFHTVSLRAALNGQSKTASSTFGVDLAQYPLPFEPPTPPPPGLMTPFPRVRLAGVAFARGTRIRLLAVRGASRRACVTVRCSGRGCPFKTRRRPATTGRVRLRRFPRLLRPRARLQVFVRAPGVIGKYTAFRMRAANRPLRTDRCLMPGSSTKPTRCP